MTAIDGQAPKTRERFAALDAWRGLCALLVAAFHFGFFTHFYFAPLMRNAYLFVDFFFVLSGFVITHAYGQRLGDAREVGTFLLRRFGRLWPLHAAVLAAFVALECLDAVILDGRDLTTGGPVFTGPRSVPAIVVNLLLLQGFGLDDELTWNYPSWSIGVEFYTYLLFAAVCCLGRRHLAAMALLLALAGLTVLAACSPGFMDATYDYGFPRALYGFFVGHLTYGLYRRRTVPLPLTPAAATWIELTTVALVVWFISIVGRDYLSFFAPLLFAGTVYVFAGESGWISRALLTRPAARLGDWSYSIYLLQALIFTAIEQAVHATERALGISLRLHRVVHGQSYELLDLGSRLLDDGLFFGYLAAVIALASLTYRRIELPARGMFNGLAHRPTGARQSGLVAPARPRMQPVGPAGTFRP